MVYSSGCSPPASAGSIYWDPGVVFLCICHEFCWSRYYRYPAFPFAPLKAMFTDIGFQVSRYPDTRVLGVGGRQDLVMVVSLGPFSLRLPNVFLAPKTLDLVEVGRSFLF